MNGAAALSLFEKEKSKKKKRKKTRKNLDVRDR